MAAVAFIIIVFVILLILTIIITTVYFYEKKKKLLPVNLPPGTLLPLNPSGTEPLTGLVPSEDLNFNNSMYQYSNPSIPREDNYYSCVAKECAGDTFDYHCLEKCHLKTFRRGMGDAIGPTDWTHVKDHADLVCHNYRKDQNAYYRCLDEIYADYRYP